jgi:AAA ATPase domain
VQLASPNRRGVSACVLTVFEAEEDATNVVFAADGGMRYPGHDRDAAIYKATLVPDGDSEAQLRSSTLMLGKGVPVIGHEASLNEIFSDLAVPGAQTLLVGSMGSGKTTFCRAVEAHFSGVRDVLHVRASNVEDIFRPFQHLFEHVLSIRDIPSVAERRCATVEYLEANIDVDFHEHLSLFNRVIPLGIDSTKATDDLPPEAATDLTVRMMLALLNSHSPADSATVPVLIVDDADELDSSALQLLGRICSRESSASGKSLVRWSVFVTASSMFADVLVDPSVTNLPALDTSSFAGVVAKMLRARPESVPASLCQWLSVRCGSNLKAVREHLRLLETSGVLQRPSGDSESRLIRVVRPLDESIPSTKSLIEVTLSLLDGLDVTCRLVVAIAALFGETMVPRNLVDFAMSRIERAFSSPIPKDGAGSWRSDSEEVLQRLETAGFFTFPSQDELFFEHRASRGAIADTLASSDRASVLGAFCEFHRIYEGQVSIVTVAKHFAHLALAEPCDAQHCERLFQHFADAINSAQLCGSMETAMMLLQLRCDVAAQVMQQKVTWGDTDPVIARFSAVVELVFALAAHPGFGFSSPRFQQLVDTAYHLIVDHEGVDFGPMAILVRYFSWAVECVNLRFQNSCPRAQVIIDIGDEVGDPVLSIVGRYAIQWCYSVQGASDMALELNLQVADILSTHNVPPTEFVNFSVEPYSAVHGNRALIESGRGNQIEVVRCVDALSAFEVPEGIPPGYVRESFVTSLFALYQVNDPISMVQYFDWSNEDKWGEGKGTLFDNPQLSLTGDDAWFLKLEAVGLTLVLRIKGYDALPDGWSVETAYDLLQEVVAAHIRYTDLNGESGSRSFCDFDPLALFEPVF